ncbi:MAG: DUF4293 domain-containing protein [Prevotellaceae bacterium]|jgi:hypothetical protein|nr:DUF4293 domain-containing protein [Prevotellaceae bacterium]
MWQRIQTIFLLLALGLETSLFLAPVWREGAAVHSIGVFMWTNSQGLFPALASVLLPASAGITLATLFLYRRRTRQIRLCRWNIAVLTGIQALIAFYFATTEMHFLTPAVFPAMAVALHFMAVCYIRRDEELVRAADRLR